MDFSLLSCAHVHYTLFFFFNATATTEIYTLSLHDALPICSDSPSAFNVRRNSREVNPPKFRSEEHTSELQSRFDLVCRLLLEKKNAEREVTRPTLATYAGEYLPNVYTMASGVTLTGYCLWAFEQSRLEGSVLLFELSIAPSAIGTLPLQVPLQI